MKAFGGVSHVIRSNNVAMLRFSSAREDWEGLLILFSGFSCVHEGNGFTLFFGGPE